MLSFPFPVVVACTGHAIAMGLFLLLSADHRIGAAGEFKLVANEVAIGMTMPRAAIEITQQRVAPAHVNRVLINAEVYDPEHAVEAGLLDRVAPADELVDTAIATARAMTALDMTAHAATKRRTRQHTLANLRAAIEGEDLTLPAPG
jgi:enoyl-CoA hydratase